MLIPAQALGKQGDETPMELNAGAALLTRVERFRRAAGLLMHLGDVSAPVIPKVALVSTPTGGSGIRSRYFVPHKCHTAHAITGAICVAGAACLPGTVVHRLATSVPPHVTVEHPGGTLPLRLRVQDGTVASAGVVTTCRRLFEGRVLVPRHVVELAWQTA